MSKKNNKHGAPLAEENITEEGITEESIAGENIAEAVESADTEVLSEASQENVEEMTEIIAEKDDVKYTDDELEDMDARRMAHVIMNDENRTDMDLLGEVFKDDSYSLKLKKKEAKKLAKEEQRRKEGETSGIRFLGTMSVLMAVAGIALVLLTVYFLAIAPTYNKSDYLSYELTFPYSEGLSDGNYTEMKEGYYVPELATDDDADTELGGEDVE